MASVLPSYGRQWTQLAGANARKRALRVLRTA